MHVHDNLAPGSTVTTSVWESEIQVTESWQVPVRFFCNKEEGLGVEFPTTAFLGVDDAMNVVEFPSGAITKVTNEVEW